MSDIKVWIISFPFKNFSLLLQELSKMLNTGAYFPEFLRMVMLGDIFTSQLQLVLVVKVNTAGAHRDPLGMIRVEEVFAR